MAEKDFLALYSNNCISCKSLVEGAAKTFKKCHYKQGNTECPAAEVKIIVVGKALAYARKVTAARNRRDTGEEAKLLSYVATQSAGFKSRFYDALNGE